jgi:uncharacterized protein (DUF4415 family)
MKKKSAGDKDIRASYDFGTMKARKNPYAKMLKQSVTIRLGRDTVRYFRGMAAETGVPYQSLINLYLRDCAAKGKRLSMRWASGGRKPAA